MSSGERKFGEVVIEVRGIPGCRVVALRAIRGEARRGVIGIIGAGEIRLVAAEAIHWRALETAAGVAAYACQRLMRPGEGETRNGVVELRDLPLQDAMALLAVGREARGPVVNDGRLVIALMTAEALRAQPDVNTSRRARMAAVARRGGVRAEKREAVPVVLN